MRTQGAYTNREALSYQINALIHINKAERIPTEVKCLTRLREITVSTPGREYAFLIGVS
jgi:hypothetical protein